jgi:hypothetical protein
MLLAPTSALSDQKPSAIEPYGSELAQSSSDAFFFSQLFERHSKTAPEPQKNCSKESFKTGFLEAVSGRYIYRIQLPMENRNSLSCSAFRKGNKAHELACCQVGFLRGQTVVYNAIRRADPEPALCRDAYRRAYEMGLELCTPSNSNCAKDGSPSSHNLNHVKSAPPVCTSLGFMIGKVSCEYGDQNLSKLLRNYGIRINTQIDKNLSPDTNSSFAPETRSNAGSAR